MLAGDEEDVAEAEVAEVIGLGAHLFGGERGAKDGVVARKPAVAAIVDALVGEVERREEPHGATELAAGQGDAALGERLELRGGGGGEHGLESAQEGRFGPIGVRKLLGEGHEGEVGFRREIVKVKGRNWGEMGEGEVLTIQFPDRVRDSGPGIQIAFRGLALSKDGEKAVKTGEERHRIGDIRAHLRLFRQSAGRRFDSTPMNADFHRLTRSDPLGGRLGSLRMG